MYKLAPPFLIRETLRMPQRVVSVNSPEEIPEDQALAYVLGGPEPPILETRTWTSCSAPVLVSDQYQLTLSLNNTVGVPIHLVLLPGPDNGENNATVVRMYRGVLRPPVE